jgi:beta-phosphoglucomutase-like phosphatase (HAD superfamily)
MSEFALHTQNARTRMRLMPRDPVREREQQEDRIHEAIRQLEKEEEEIRKTIALLSSLKGQNYKNYPHVPAKALSGGSKVRRIRRKSSNRKGSKISKRFRKH